MASIEFDAISKRYGDGYLAVKDLSIEMQDGEFLVLVGPSGCGKSTALRMAAGLEDISAGELRIGGQVVNDLAPRERDIAMVFQSYALYPHLSVRDNIGFGLRVRGTSKTERNEAVERAAGLLELTEHLDRKPAQLSGGQRQRVAMGRAIVRRPAAFLMDEPLSNLDAKLRVSMRAEITRLQKLTATTTIYVTHDQIEAMTMGDRVAVLAGGVLQQIGPPRDLYEKPVNLFVASFIGSPSMNLIGATIGSNGQTIEMKGQAMKVPNGELRDKISAFSGKEVVIGIRPEYFSLASDDTATMCLKAEASMVEHLGSTLLVHLRSSMTEEDAILVDKEAADDISRKRGEFLATLDADAHVAEGDAVSLAVPETKIHLFDRQTGETLV